jgi:RNA polymerase sigma factor (sigma-70 family)
VIDQELLLIRVIRGLNEGDPDRAWGELADRLRPAALRVADRVFRHYRAPLVLSEEAFQEALARLFRHLHRIACDRSPVPYFLTIVRRAAIDLARREVRQRHLIHSAALSGALTVPAPGPESPSEDAVPAVLGTLPRQGQELLSARYVRELSAAAIAAEFGLSVAVVYRRLHKFRCQLRAAIGAEQSARQRCDS